METSSIAQTRTKKAFKPFASMIKKSVLSILNKLEYGTVIIEDNDDTYRYEGHSEPNKIAVIKVNSESFYLSVFSRGSVGAAEAYIDGEWSTPNLLQVVQVMCSNLELLNTLKMSRFLPTHLIEKALHKGNENSKTGSRKNISKHYDLSNDFFSLFLDSSMMYSAAIFKNKNQPLLEASKNKLDVICQKLQLSPSDHVLEIGTGWGGFAIHAATNYGCKVTTTTISKKQYDYTQKKIEALGLQDSITLLLEDYRDLKGQYDKIVSIEMIEAVGHKYYNSYFSKCSSLLKRHGLMLIQAITIPGQRYEQAKNSVDFIQKYIFPGGCLPSIQVISEKVSTCTDMQIVNLTDITHHYADTLLQWHTEFNHNLNKVKQLGFDDRFCRMWNYYLCYCEGGFRERIINTNHILMAKPNYIAG